MLHSALIHVHIPVSSRVPGALSGAIEEGGRSGGKNGPKDAQWWDPQPLPGGREAGRREQWERSHLGPDGKRPRVPARVGPAPSLLLGEVILAWTAVGQAGGWDVTGPRQWWRWVCGKSLRGEPQALCGNGDMEHGAPALCRGLWGPACPPVGMEGDPAVLQEKVGCLGWTLRKFGLASGGRTLVRARGLGPTPQLHKHPLGAPSPSPDKYTHCQSYLPEPTSSPSCFALNPSPAPRCGQDKANSTSSAKVQSPLHSCVSPSPRDPIPSLAHLPAAANPAGASRGATPAASCRCSAAQPAPHPHPRAAPHLPVTLRVRPTQLHPPVLAHFLAWEFSLARIFLKCFKKWVSFYMVIFLGCFFLML